MGMQKGDYCGDEDCGMLTRYTGINHPIGASHWHDFPCDREIPYVCKGYLKFMFPIETLKTDPKQDSRKLRTVIYFIVMILCCIGCGVGICCCCKKFKKGESVKGLTDLSK